MKGTLGVFETDHFSIAQDFRLWDEGHAVPANNL